MFSAEQALSKPNEAVAVSKETRQAIHSLRFEVDAATKQYARHRRLLDGFIESASGEQDGKPEAGEGTAPATRGRAMLEELLEGVGGEKQDAKQPGQEEAAKDNGGATGPRTPAKDQSNLYREFKGRQAGK